MPKKVTSKTKQMLENKVAKNSLWDIFKIGESYTSLILGIVVVIVATIMLLTFAKGRNSSTNKTNKPALSQQILEDKNKLSPTISTASPSKRKFPIKKKITVTTENKAAIDKTQKINGSIYVVAQGDSLWDIAVKKYNNGYNWIDIQKANRLTNPDVIITGTKLLLPKVVQSIATDRKVNNSSKMKTYSTQVQKISGTSYVVVKDDSLWNIAVRAYGDGYAWTKISSANRLLNPNIIHRGNKLLIPRGK